MIDSRSHYTAFWQDWLKTESRGKSSHGHPHVPYHHAVLYVLGCTRATLMYSLCSSRFPFWCGWCEASSDTGCDSCYGDIQMVVVVVTLDTEPKGT